MDVRLTDAGPDDLPLIERWLQAEDVSRYWGGAEENVKLLRAEAGAGQWRAVIEVDGRKAGLVLWQHPTRRELDEAGLRDVPESVVDIDIMIGEADSRGRGAGSAAIRLVAGIALADQKVPYVIAAAEVDNRASQRAFEKAGFVVDREFDDVPYGRCVLMVKRRGGGGK